MTKTFYLMRHGQTLFNVRRKIQGACDSPLTELGIQQAEAAAKYFDTITFDKLYASTSERASDTLEIATRNRMPYTRLKGLKEMNFGTYEGESEDLNPDRETFETFFVAYGGESRDMVKERMKETCLNIMRQADHDCVLAVSHAGACLHFLRNWADPSVVFNAGGFKNCAILKFEYDNDVFTFVEVIHPEVVE